MPQPDLNAYLSPESFWTPDKVVMSAWLQHGPFAFWIVAALKPRSIVELGTHHGFSYLAFCQAVRRLALPTKCYAVDTWQGDEHSDPYPERVYNELKEYHDARYGDFSRLVRSRFDEAAPHFANGSVDLLHVDGRHFYEDAKEDYETWLPKLSDRAIVLFHDINVRERDFGVWRLWHELKSKHPSFEFGHGNGLGVLGIGREQPDACRHLFQLDDDQRSAAQGAYLRLGQSVEDRLLIELKLPELRRAKDKPQPMSSPAIIRGSTPIHIHLAAMAPRFLDVRTYLPLKEMAKVSGISTSSSDAKIEFPKLPVDQPKVMIVQRMSINSAKDWSAGLKQLEDKGWIAISEIDDHPDLLGRVHRRAVDPDSWHPASLVHAVQTSTDALAGELRQHNPEVAVFRNAAFKLPIVKPARSVPGLRVFFGALNRESYSAQVGAALAPFAAAHPDVEFVVVHDRAFFQALGPCKKTFHPTTPTYEGYTALMETCDVCLMPLEGQSGELFKSDLKFVEASSAGLVSIGSVPVYGATIKDGDTGLIAEALADWPRQLERLCSDPALRTRLGLAAQDYVRRERQFSQQIGDRLDWYRDLWARRDELSKAARQRVAAVSTQSGQAAVAQTG